MNLIKVVILAINFSFLSLARGETITMNPNDIKLNNYVHKNLSPELLKRIKATTDVFEVIDGISYNEAVDLYKRDLDPESNLIIFEEMARVYKKICNSRCSTKAEKLDVYQILLLRSMFSSEETLSKLKTSVITRKQAEYIVSQYRLKAKPIDVIQK